MNTTGPDATVTIPEITVRLTPKTITVPTTVSSPGSATQQVDMTSAEAAVAGDRNDFINGFSPSS